LRGRKARPIRPTVTYRVRGWKVRFDWDAAGVLPDGSIVLVEAELGQIQDWHIQMHVTRLAVMVAKKTKVDQLIWVTRAGTQNKLKNVVQTWLLMLGSAVNAAIPRMEYLTVEQLD